MWSGVGCGDAFVDGVSSFCGAGFGGGVVIQLLRTGNRGWWRKIECLYCECIFIFTEDETTTSSYIVCPECRAALDTENSKSYGSRRQLEEEKP